MPFLTLDTNVILLDANNLTAFPDDYIIVLPETVVDELDSKKTGFTEIAYQAREFGRLLSKAHKLSTSTMGDLSINSFKLSNKEIWIVASTSYEGVSQYEASIRNDRKILQIAATVAKLHPLDTMAVVSNDVMFRIRAESMGLSSQDFKQVDHYTFEFTKKLEVPETLFSELHHKAILQIDPDYKPENYNYLFSCPTTDQIKPACIINGTIQVLGKTTEEELRRQDANPINVDQLLLSRAIQDPSTDLIVCEARAGSGFH